ncbi:MAG: hypothetical protein COA94_03430 [Rickettsiales bacterium]|nr:MAG: hypothetical protein COA94_03430 [Rickettsiales bacterium]
MDQTLRLVQNVETVIIKEMQRAIQLAPHSLSDRPVVPRDGKCAVLIEGVRATHQLCERLRDALRHLLQLSRQILGSGEGDVEGSGVVGVVCVDEGHPEGDSMGRRRSVGDECVWQIGISPDLGTDEVVIVSLVALRLGLDRGIIIM